MLPQPDALDGQHSSLGGLLATCALMFLGAYGAGMLPSWVPVTEQRMASVSAVGAGLLLGSALCIILPEGFEAAHASEPGLPEWSVSLAVLAGFWCMLALDALSQSLPASTSTSSIGNGSHGATRADETAAAAAEYVGDADAGGGDAGAEELVILLTDTPGRDLRATSSSRSQPSTPKGSSAAAAAGESPFAAKSGASSSSSSLRPLQQQQQQQQVRSASSRGASSNAMSRLGSTRGSAAAATGGGSGTAAASWLQQLQDPSQQALLGLLVHAASDGLAVGAAALSSQPAVSLGVAAAMVVHKGPVALGLAAYLRSARWSPAAVHRGILVFSLASPAAALLVYMLFQVLPFLSSGSNIPLAVLFSGGTVLYAATMHILPSALGGGHHHHQGSTAAAGTAAGSGKSAVAGASRHSLLLLVSLGMLLPLLLTASFDHGH